MTTGKGFFELLEVSDVILVFGELFVGGALGFKVVAVVQEGLAGVNEIPLDEGVKERLWHHGDVGVHVQNLDVTSLFLAHVFDDVVTKVNIDLHVSIFKFWQRHTIESLSAFLEVMHAQNI